MLIIKKLIEKMKTIQRVCSLLLLWWTVWGLSPVQAQTYSQLWKQVEQAQKKSLPQTVIKLTDEIYRKGEREQNAGQMLKAYICREEYRERLTPDSLYSNLQNLERWAMSEKNPVNKAILHSLLAQEYVDLMRRNRRTLLARTPLDADADEVSADVREWSSSQFAERIDRHARASLQDSARLLEASAEGYVPFTVLADGSRFYRHDMYHLLARRAVSVYEGLNGFRVDSLQSLRIRSIYEQMMETYRHRAGAEDAVVLCTLDYWKWKKAHAFGYEPYQVRESRRKQMQTDEECLLTLDGLIEKYGNREVCAEVYIEKASYLRSGAKGCSVAEALKVCDEGLRRYPAYKRINELRNIRAQILQPELGVSARESGYPGSTMEVRASYKNLSGFTLNLYSTTLKEIPWMDHGINPDTYKKYARKLSSTHYALKPKADDGKLPEDVPYLASDTVLQLPVPEETGVYILQVVPDAGNARTESRFFTATRFKVLTLDLGDGRKELVTLDASTGQPIADAKITFYSTYDERERKQLAEVVTDAQGKAVLAWQEGFRSYVARKGNDTAMRPQRLYGWRPHRNDVREEDRREVALLTDRSIYRPGQTVYIKGIAYLQGKESARVLEGEEYELVLRDANRKELATRKVRTNDFGSFTTEFTLPAACLNGVFSVEAKTVASAYVYFRVEEYKRPTFEIAFTPVAEAYRLGDRVMLKGNVKAFNGRTVQEVPIAYTVRRQDIYRGYWNRTDKPLLADTLQLDADGNFAIPLKLDAPDGATAQTTKSGIRNTYTYIVEAAVTDEAGETQTATYSLDASYRVYSFRADLPSYLCKEDSLIYTFGVYNAMTVPQEVKGICRLYPIGDDGKDASAQPAWEREFIANRAQEFADWRALPSGNYRVELSVRDSQGREETNEDYSPRFMLFSKQDACPAACADFFYYGENEEFDATRPASFLLGTSHKDAYVLMDVFCNQKRIESRVLQWSDTIVRMEYPYKEEYGEGVALLFYFVKNGQVYSQHILLKKRQPERILDMKWEVFRDRLRPGQAEEWKLIVKTPQGGAAAAELLATMYDASLDKLYPNNQLLRLFYPNRLYAVGRDMTHYGNTWFSLYFPLKSWRVPVWGFDYFCSPYVGLPAVAELSIVNDEAVATTAEVAGYAPRRLANAAGVQFKSAATKAVEEEAAAVFNDLFEEEVIPMGQALQPLDGLRTNFAETAFFYPQLRTNEQGEVALSFTMPQSLTRWSFRGYAHTKEMLTGMLQASAVTAKEFMLTPNMPRFVRTGDKTRIAATIANQTDKAVKGTATFTLFDPVTEKVIATQRKKFAAEAGKNAAVDFGFEATDRYRLLGVRIVADGGAFSDGEQHLLPVLSNKEYITETLAMPIRGEQTRTFALDSLFNRDSRTATDRRLTVEFTGNPAWYAVQALPALSLPATENAVSWAAAYYANSLAGYIANSQPRIKAVFDSWKAAGGTKETFLSQLEKNQDVKNILLNESPWVMEAASEAERRARIATLFDVNLLDNRNLSALTKLKELQGEDGGWSWYKGMRGSRHITDYVAGLLIRLPLMTGEVQPSEVQEMKRKAFGYLHQKALEEYRDIRKAEKNGAKFTINSEAAMQYLYLIALSGEKVPAGNQAAHRYFLSKVGGNLKDGSMIAKAQSAVILHAAGRTAEANEFIASLKEHLVQTDEMGAHFAFHAHPYRWGMMPIPAHVPVMEALNKTGGNGALVEEMKLWLLKQKQTTGWNSPVTTADAVYALLCQGGDLLESRGDVRVALGKKVIETLSPAQNAVPGLAVVRETFTQGDAELKAKSVTVEKRDAGIAWGAVYAQYLSPVSDVKQQGGELNVKKELFVERVSADGKKSLQPIAGNAELSVGDKVVSRLIISLDRAMDFVQLKDQRGACFEPTGALSGYRWNNGAGVYVEVKDAATNFFFDHLGKGVYVLEHSCRIARSGTYETGLATVQCAYAPEYASHSAGGTIVIR